MEIIRTGVNGQCALSHVELDLKQGPESAIARHLRMEDGPALIKDLVLQLKEPIARLLTALVGSICGALHDLVPFVQFKKREKHPWRSVNFSKVAACNFTKINTPP